MRKWIPLLTVCLGTFMLLIDVTIVNVALPDMVGDLDASFTSLQWVIDAYALSLAALVLGAGSIADLVGHRRAYIAGLVLFALSSLVCGLAPNVGVLIAARAVQGVGGAAMFATTFALLNSSYQGRDRGIAYGMWGAVAGAAASVGPIIGGLLTQGASWRWIFIVNIPLSLVAIALCVWRLTDTQERRKARVDVPGILLFSAAVSAVVYALIRANEHSWGNQGTWWLLLVSALLLAAFVAVERSSPHAMFDLELLRHRSFVGVLIAGIMMTFAAFAAFTYTSIWLQSVLGLSPIEAGLTGLPMSVMAFAVSAGIGRFLHGAQAGRVIGCGLLLIGAGGVVGAIMVHGDAGWPALVPGFFVIGIGVGLATPTVSSAAMAAVPLQRGGMAAGAVNTARQLGLAFGVAALGSVFAVRAQHVLSGVGLPDAAEAGRAVAGGRSGLLLAAAPADARAVLNEAVRESAVAGVQSTLLVAGIVGLVAGTLALILIRPAAAPAAVPSAPAVAGMVRGGGGVGIGAALTVLDPAGRQVGRATALNGAFRIPLAAPGRYLLAVQAAGHDPVAAIVEVGTAEARQDLVLIPVPADGDAPPAGELFGAVRLAAVPVEHALVAALGADGTLLAVARTNSYGGYRLSTPAAIEVLLAVAPGALPVAQGRPAVGARSMRDLELHPAAGVTARG